jgi:hypothetical protein
LDELLRSLFPQTIAKESLSQLSKSLTAVQSQAAAAITDAQSLTQSLQQVCVIGLSCGFVSLAIRFNGVQQLDRTSSALTEREMQMEKLKEV